MKCEFVYELFQSVMELMETVELQWDFN